VPGNAARVGDSTAHGGVIMPPGAPLVMIGGKPAARVGDMHVCPMLNPGLPPPPHVGAAILPPGVPTVLIGGQPAACVGDMVTCSGPPDTIIPPGCPTVIIGMGGSGGGGAGSGAKGGAQAKSAAVKVDDGHYLDVKFVDKGGKPITGVQYSVKTPDGQLATGPLTGRIQMKGLQQGNCEIILKAFTKVAWSTKQAAVGDKVKLTAETAGIDNGEKAVLEIFVRDANFADRLLKTIESKVDGGKIQEDWVLEIDDDLLKIQTDKEQKGGYSYPSFYFRVSAGGLMSRSGLLEYKDYIEIELKDEAGKPVPKAAYKVILPNGVIIEGTLDQNGYAKIDKVPPGKVRVLFDIRQSK